MPTDRIFRFTIAGSVFLLFCLYFYWLLGGSFFFLEEKGDKWGAIVAVLIATPVLGFIISTFALGVVVIWKGYKTFFYLPDLSTSEGKYILSNLLHEQSKYSSETRKIYSRLMHSIKEGKSHEFDDIELRQVFVVYQAKVKSIIKGEPHNYLERRWSGIWTFVNSLMAIFLSVIITPFCMINKYNFENLLINLVTLLLPLFFVLIAIHQIKTQWSDANKVEHLFLKKHYVKKEAKRKAEDGKTEHEI